MSQACTEFGQKFKPLAELVAQCQELIEKFNQTNKVSDRKKLGVLVLELKKQYQKEIEAIGYIIDSDNNLKMFDTFKCNPDQIARTLGEIKEDTQAYIGPWNIEVLQTIKNYPNINHLYESFPDKEILFQTIETDPEINSWIKARDILEEEGVDISYWAKDILQKTEFSQKSQTYHLVRFTVGQLGFPNAVTIEQVYQRAKKLGLKLCPAEVGPQLRLKNKTESRMLIAMERIADLDGGSDVFLLYGLKGVLKLHAYRTLTNLNRPPDEAFVFCISDPQKPTENN